MFKIKKIEMMLINRVLIAAFSLLLVVGCKSEPKYSEPIRIGSYNIQYPPRGEVVENGWNDRNLIIEKVLKEIDFDIFGSQEPFLSQIEDMMQYLGDTYQWVGTTDVRGGSAQYGVHHNPIFYKKGRFVVKDQGQFWLSETPDTLSKFEDSHSIRTCNWALFEDVEQQTKFYHFNCHFDHRGEIARERSAILICEKIAEIAGSMPIFLTGDFNTSQTSVPYETITTSGVVVDSYAIAQRRINEDWHSYNGYVMSEVPMRNSERIDHLFVTPSNSKVVEWELNNSNYNGKYPSDHFPIIAEWSILKK